MPSYRSGQSTGHPVKVRRHTIIPGHSPPVDDRYTWFEQNVAVDASGGVETDNLQRSYTLECGCLVLKRDEFGARCDRGLMVCRDHYELCLTGESPRPGMTYCCRKKRWRAGIGCFFAWLFGRPEEDEDEPAETG